MPIKTDNADIPRGASGGNPPDEHPRFVTAVADAWYQQYIEAGKDVRAMSFDTPFRGSDAGFCSYSLALTLLERAGLGTQSNPPTLSDTWRMSLGTMIHAQMEHYLPLAFPGAECEVVGKTIDDEASFHADVLIKDKGKRTLFELKTINGTGFKSATIGFRKDTPPEGPRSSAVLQAALAAEAFNCDEVVIGYLAMELIGPAIAKTNGLDDTAKFAAEWTYSRDEFIALAEDERARLRFIKATVDAGRMPDRVIPDLPRGSMITDPATGAWTVTDAPSGTILDIGTTWQCNYCRHQDSCVALKAEGK